MFVLRTYLFLSALFLTLTSCILNSHLKVNDPTPVVSGQSGQSGNAGNNGAANFEITKLETINIFQNSVLITMETNLPARGALRVEATNLTHNFSITLGTYEISRGFEVFDLFSEGIYTFTYEAEDVDGNTDVESIEVIMPLANTPFVISDFSVKTLLTDSVTLNLETNKDSIGVVKIIKDGTTDIVQQKDLTTFEMQRDVIISSIAPGVYNATFDGEDRIGNTDSKTIQFEVVAVCEKLTITEFKVIQIQNNDVKLKVMTDNDAKGDLYYNKKGDGNISKISFSDFVSMREIDVTSLMNGIEYEFEFIAEDAHGNVDKKELTVLIENMEPELECLDIAEGYNVSDLQEVTFIAGSKDNLVGAEEGDHPATPGYINAMAINGQTRALFDGSSVINKYTLAEINLDTYKGKIACISAKIRARDEGDSLFHTDTVNFHVTPYGTTAAKSDWDTISSYSFFREKISRTTVDYTVAPIFTKSFQLTNQVYAKNAVKFIDAINFHGNLRFHYQDDAAIDYLEVKILYQND